MHNFIEREIRLNPREKKKLEESLHGTMGCPENASLLQLHALTPFLLPHSWKKSLSVSDTLLPQGVFILRLLVNVNLISVTQECKKNTALA